MTILKPVFNILKQFFNDRDLNLKLLISGNLSKYPSQSRNEITRVVYGIARKEKLINYIAGKFSNRRPEKTDRETLILLYIGIYLLHFSGSYPGYAVVNEITGFSMKRSKGFLNAVLRKISDNSAEIEKVIKNLKSPDIKYSVSTEILENLEKIVPAVEDALKYLDTEPKFHVRTDDNPSGLKQAAEILTRNKIPFHFLKDIQAFEIVEAGKMVREVIRDHPFYFQNSGSFAVSAIASFYAKKDVLDCCAAPGTKSITLSLLRPDTSIIACDINLNRLKLSRPFLKKGGLTNIELVTGDIRTPPFKNKFDTILIDSPCTSAGTLRKNPDLKLKTTGQRIEKNSTLQKQILGSVAAWAEKDTAIIYSVCSFIEDETESVVNECFNHCNNNELEIISIENILHKYGFTTKKGRFGIYLLPDRKLNNDLFYISALRKK